MGIHVPEEKAQIRASITLIFCAELMEVAWNPWSSGVCTCGTWEFKMNFEGKMENRKINRGKEGKGH